MITPHTKYVKDYPLYEAITWRRVIVDEAHQLSANVPGSRGLSRAQKDIALLKKLATIPVSISRWCLSGTPLKNFRQMSSMDRIFCFLCAGFTTGQLSGNQFVEVMGRLAVRFTKQGHFQVGLASPAAAPRSSLFCPTVLIPHSSADVAVARLSCAG